MTEHKFVHAVWVDTISPDTHCAGDTVGEFLVGILMDIKKFDAAVLAFIHSMYSYGSNEISPVQPFTDLH